jgi:hypothetical protein
MVYCIWRSSAYVRRGELNSALFSKTATRKQTKVNMVSVSVHTTWTAPIIQLKTPLNACYQCLSSSAIKPAGTQCFLVASAGTHPSFRRQVVQPEPLGNVPPLHFEHPRSPSDTRLCEKVTLFLPKRLSPIGGSSSVVPQGVSRAGRSRSGFGYGSGNTRKHACTL